MKYSIRRGLCSVLSAAMLLSAVPMQPVWAAETPAAVTPAATQTDIPLDSAHFPDDTFRAYLGTEFDLDQDGTLSVDECNQVTDIYIENVSSMAGIQYFPNLTKLNCSGYGLTVLDLSSNSKLEVLICTIPNLKMVDLSHNPKLRVLNCASSGLVVLDLSNNRELTTLDCSSNALTALNVSHLTNLTSLKCQSNKLHSLTLRDNPQLTTLDCSQNPSLTTLTYPELPLLTALHVSDTALDTLDLSQLPNLTNLSCAGLSLTALDLSNNPELKDLRCNQNQLTGLNLSTCPNLEILYATQNQLTGLDLSACPKLQILYCNQNQIATLRLHSSAPLGTVFCQENQLTELDLGNCTTLSHLECGTNRITSLTLSDMPDLDYLDCSSNDLTSLTLTNLPRLTKLYAASNKLTELNLSGMNQLDSVDCSCNPLTSLSLANLPALQTVSADHTYLTELNLSGLGELSSLNLANGHLRSLSLTNLPKLSTVIANNNQLTALTMDQLPMLYELNFDHNQLASLDVSPCSELTKLLCSDNQLTNLNGLSGKPLSLENSHCDNNVYTVAEKSFDYTTLPGAFDFDSVSAVTGGTFDPSTNLFTFEEGSVYATFEYATGRGNFTPIFAFRYDSAGKAPDPAADDLTMLFPDPVFREFVSQFDTDKDNKLSSTEKDAVTELSLDGLQNLHSFNGIEQFPNLQTLNILNCTADSASPLALNLSRNAMLTTLNIPDAGISALTLAPKTELTTLDCSGDQLTVLDLSAMPKLTNLNCSGNQISILDLTKTPELTNLNCGQNAIGYLNLSQSQKLQELYCSENLLTYLDVSGSPGLQTLDVSYQPVQNLIGLEHLTQLTDLSLADADLKTLNLRSCAALTNLSCNGCNLDSLDVSQNLNLESLSCRLNNLTELDVSQNPRLTSLKCNFNQLTALDLTQNPDLDTLICNNNDLTSLDLSKNRMWGNLICSDNTYQVSGKSFDYTTLPGNFDVTSVSNVSGGTFDPATQTFTFESGATNATYDYALRDPDDSTATFTLNLAEAPMFTGIAGSSMNLKNSLSMIFYVNRADFPASMQNDQFYILMQKSYHNDQPDAMEIVWNQDWETNIDGLCGASFHNISAKEMCDEITAQVFYANGTPASEVFTNNVRAYAGEMLKDPESTDSLKTVLVDMLNYGAEAQKKLNYNTADLANRRLTDDLKALATKSVTMQDSCMSHELHYGTSLNLGNNLSLFVYFTGQPAAGMFATVSFTDHTGLQHKTRVSDLTSNVRDICLVRADEMSVSDCSAPVTITVYNADGTVYSTVTDSIESYLARANAQENAPIYEAVMKFATSAKSYFATRK